MNFEISESQRQMLERARELARRYLAMRATRADGPSASEADALGALAREVWPAAALPAKRDAREPWALDLCLILEGLGEGSLDAGFVRAVSAHLHAGLPHLEALNLERLTFAASWVGILRELFSRCVHHLRIDTSGPASKKQMQRHRLALADVEISHELCKNVVRRAAWELRSSSGPLASLVAAKELVAAHAERAARFALVIAEGGSFEEDARRLLSDAVTSSTRVGDTARMHSVIADAFLALRER
jgi:alkylation response protein AidB-like acyl-CoA dehydrogenase